MYEYIHRDFLAESEPDKARRSRSPRVRGHNLEVCPSTDSLVDDNAACILSSSNDESAVRAERHAADDLQSGEDLLDEGELAASIDAEDSDRVPARVWWCRCVAVGSVQERAIG